MEVSNCKYKKMNFVMSEGLKKGFDLMLSSPDKYCILLDAVGNLYVWNIVENKRVLPFWRVNEKRGVLPLLAIASYAGLPVHTTEHIVTNNGLVNKIGEKRNAKRKEN